MSHCLRRPTFRIAMRPSSCRSLPRHKLKNCCRIEVYGGWSTWTLAFWKHIHFKFPLALCNIILTHSPLLPAGSCLPPLLSFYSTLFVAISASFSPLSLTQYFFLPMPALSEIVCLNAYCKCGHIFIHVF